jgi:hypothetical protein
VPVIAKGNECRIFGRAARSTGRRPFRSRSLRPNDGRLFSIGTVARWNLPANAAAIKEAGTI